MYPLKILIPAIIFWAFTMVSGFAQSMTLDQYNLAIGAIINDLDVDTYVKVNDEYVLDRYQMKPPYFVAGTEGTKNRVDLYSFISREGMEMLGILMIYTNQTTGRETRLCLPLAADAEVWTKYYDGLKYGGQEDPALSFAIGSVVSKELSQLLKTGGNPENYTVESSDYDICFEGGTSIMMADKSIKSINMVKVDDYLSTIDNGKMISTPVLEVEQHEGNFQFVEVVVLPEGQLYASKYAMLNLLSVAGTNNHPIVTTNGIMPIEKLKRGDKVFTESGGRMITAEVVQRNVFLKKAKVYNLITEAGSYMAGGILVQDKSGSR